MRVFAVGDVCGEVGCKAILKLLPKIKKEKNIGMVIVNGENSAVGNGITPESAGLIFSAGADIITGGNHSLCRKEVYDMLDENPFLLRPDNIKCDYGSGYCLLDLGRTSAAVINLLGRYGLEKLGADNPFIASNNLIERAKSDGAKMIFVDFHAEATSEKKALGLYLDGRVSAVFGTHTHIQTADATVLPKGTGYITDLGMTGPKHSVLGVKGEIIINRFVSGDPTKFEFADGNAILNGCIFDVDETSGLTISAEPIFIKEA
ncbi:MAG: TIGR00282 family metallophosphoesterase [Clostridia bacterium]|nr:TIGR00282 family metallophosphoesterase [Clostridia bacterium]